MLSVVSYIYNLQCHWQNKSKVSLERGFIIVKIFLENTFASILPAAATDPTPNSPAPALKYGFDASDKIISVTAMLMF